MPPNLHQQKSEQTRERLLDAALELMQSKGGAVSMHEVARFAGMTTGAVQHHFPSKADLMLQIITRIVQQIESSDAFWPQDDWPLAQRADHFVREAWAQLYGQKRFNVAWAAYLAVREDEVMVAHIREQRSQLKSRLQTRMARTFPEMCCGAQAAARTQFVLSALRGLGVVAPFSPEGVIPEQLQVLSQFIQSFQSGVGQ